MDEKKTNAESFEEFDKQMKEIGQAASEMFGALAGILSDTGTEKQFVRFVKNNAEQEE